MTGTPRGAGGAVLYRVRTGDLCLARHPRGPGSGSHATGIRGHRAGVSAGIEGGLRNRSPTQRPGAVSAIHSGLLMTTQSREAGADRRTTARARPVTVTGNSRRPGSGAPAHPPHHVPVHWLPGHQDHRGQGDCQRPHGKGDGRPGDRPCMLHPASIEPRRSPARTMVNSLPGRPAGTRINMTCQPVTSVPRPPPPGTRRAAWTIGDSQAITGRGAQITGLCASEVDRICRNEDAACAGL